MSITIQTLITCDGDSMSCTGNDWSADSSYLTATEQRRNAKEKLGWHHSKGEDFCATCWKELQERKAVQATL